MARTISIVAQSFLFLRKHGCFYVDKTDFIRIWWDGTDVSTLICRPRRFGKTLMLSTVEAFLSTQYANRSDELFGGLAVWDNANMRALQGSIPVISLSLASCKGPSFNIQQRRMCEQLAQSWRAHSGELSPLALSSYEKRLVSMPSHLYQSTFARRASCASPTTRRALPLTTLRWSSVA